MKNMNARVIVVTVVLVLCSALTACSGNGAAIDPGTWGYGCDVTYDALGGSVNAREVRKTYYESNSYLFQPSGSSNMLVQPVRDGYTLAGWYTAKSAAPQGSTDEYSFSASARWDFSTDRVQKSMTLYARWIPKGKVDYVNAGTGDVIFSKNITADSPIQKLSDSVMKLKGPRGSTLAGYYADAACTQEYDFAAFKFVDPNPTEADIYAELYRMFPEYLEKVDPKASAQTVAAGAASSDWLFLKKLGYNLKTTDMAALGEIRAAKDQLIETAIQTYLTNTASRVVYLKFNVGNYIEVHSAKDLKIGSKYGFFDTDANGDPITGYNIDADIDMSGIVITASDKFSGKIAGNGHVISNLTISASSRKIDTDTEKSLGLAKLMDGAVISDLTFKNAKVTLAVNSGIRITAGLLAANAQNVTLTNCHFSGLTLSSGKGDDGQAEYQLGDLFGSYDNCTFNNCSADGFSASVRLPDKLTLAVGALPK